MPEAGALRVVTFEPQVPEPVTDAALRDDIIPQMSRLDGVRHCLAGRRGLADGEVRVIASVWASAPAAAEPEAQLIGAAARDLQPLLDRARVEVHPIEVQARFQRDEPARILRVFRGHVGPGEMDAYLAEARKGMLGDAAINSGLIAFYLGTLRPDAFLTVSAWTSWSAIELATGGDVRRPFVTRNSARLVGFEIVHFEILGEGLGEGLDAADPDGPPPPES